MSHGAASSFIKVYSNMPDTLVSGTITAQEETVSLTLGGHKSCSVTVSGTWTGTLVAESSTDNGVTWIVAWLQSIAAAITSTLLSPVNSFTENGAYSIYVVSGITDYRIRATTDTAWTGTATVKLTATEVVGPIFTATSVIGLSDQFGFSGQFSPMKSLQVVEIYHLVGASFGATIDSNFWTAANSGAGSAAGVASSIATVTSGTANSGYGKISSVQSGRFVFAAPMKFRGAFRLTALTAANTIRGWGPVTLSTVAPQNGPFFSVDAAGVLSVNHASNGSVTSVASGSFNGAVTSFVMDTNAHAFEIVYFTMGIWFYVDGQFIHKFIPATSVLYQTISNPINFWVANDASGVTSASLECWNASIMRIGRALTAPKSVYISGATAGQVLKIGTGVVQKINLSMVNNNSVITLYDNTAASGTVLWGFDSGNVDRAMSFDFSELPFSVGLTVVQTGAGTKVTYGYE